MKPETATILVTILIGLSQGLNVFMFYRIRVAQLETEKEVLKQVDEKYVRKDSALLTERPHTATC